MAKIGIFDLVKSMYYMYFHGVASRTFIDVPDNADKIDIYIDGRYSGIIESISVSAILMYSGVPIYYGGYWNVEMGEHLNLSIGGYTDLKGKKLDISFEVFWASPPRVTISDYYDSVWTNVIHVDFYSSDNLVKSEGVDMAIYSPNALNSAVGSAVSRPGWYAIIPLSDYILKRLDYILILVYPEYPYYPHHAAPSTYITELDGSNNVINVYRSVPLNYAKFVPSRNAKKILVALIPRGDPRNNWSEITYIVFYGKYIEGLPVSPPPPP